MVALDIMPKCGSAMPDGPTVNPSRCLTEDVYTFASSYGDLHFHHEPELQEWEQSDRLKVCDSRRIVLLCDRCHNGVDASRHHRGAA